MINWKSLSSSSRVEEIRLAYPQTIGTATAIASYLSEKFGETITRNAVIGFYSRYASALKSVPLTNAGNPFAENRPAKVTPLVRTPRIPKKKADPVKAAEIKKIESRPVPADIPRPLLFTVLELGRNDCRWPVQGEKASTLFCGHNTEPGCPYRPGHKRLSIGKGTESERTALKVLRKVA